jgi:hypothetical protein
MFVNELIHEKIVININKIDENIGKTLENMIEIKNGGVCISNGYVKPNSIKLKTYSSPIIEGINVIFDVVYSADIFNPIIDMILKCKIDTITTVGIEGYLYSETFNTSPFIVYLPRDFLYNNEKFQELKVDDIFTCKVISSTYKLYDKVITIYGKLI